MGSETGEVERVGQRRKRRDDVVPRSPKHLLDLRHQCSLPHLDVWGLDHHLDVGRQMDQEPADVDGRVRRKRAGAQGNGLVGPLLAAAIFGVAKETRNPLSSLPLPREHRSPR